MVQINTVQYSISIISLNTHDIQIDMQEIILCDHKFVVYKCSTIGPLKIYCIPELIY